MKGKRILIPVLCFAILMLGLGSNDASAGSSPLYSRSGTL